jgi:hypothetical protein
MLIPQGIARFLPPPQCLLDRSRSNRLKTAMCPCPRKETVTAPGFATFRPWSRHIPFVVLLIGGTKKRSTRACATTSCCCKERCRRAIFTNGEHGVVISRRLAADLCAALVFDVYISNPT